MSRLKELPRILTLRCREASMLASRALDEPLSVSERIALGGHRLVCASCRRFGRQLRLLHEALKNRRIAPDPDSGLSPEARSRIEEVLVRASDEESGPPT